jgi:tetratricopeptide (TPR) repeat protein
LILGQAHSALGNFQNALESFKISQNLENSENIKNEILKVKRMEKSLKDFEYYEKKNLFDNCFQSLEDILQEIPHSVYFHLKKGEILLNLCNFRETLEVCSKVLQFQPENPDVLYLKAKCFYFKGNIESCLKILEIATEEHQEKKLIEFKTRMNSILKYFQEGDNYLQQECLQVSFEMFSACIRLSDPDAKKFNAKAYHKRSIVSFKMNNISLAKEGSHNSTQ